MKNQSKKKRIGAVLAAIGVALSFACGNVLTAYAEDSSSSSGVGAFTGSKSPVSVYDESAIIDDLPSLKVSDYPKDENGHHQVIQFSEFCYSEKTLLDEHYGLYFYVYNPTEVPVYEYGNVALMANGYNTDGTPAGYSNVELTILDTAYNNRFLKFKVKDSAGFLAKARAYAAAHGGKRRYDIAGLQLRHTSGSYQMDEAFGKTYYCSGYAKGYGAQSTDDSSLSVRVDTLETIELEVFYTYYRTEDYQNYVCDELDSVYFAVPNRYFREYGDKLQKIKAEWWEYKTNPIFVTKDNDAYEEMQSYIGLDLSGYENMSREDLDWRVLWEETYEYGSQRNFLLS